MKKLTKNMKNNVKQINKVIKTNYWLKILIKYEIIGNSKK
jgi:hypothetical protein